MNDHELVGWIDETARTLHEVAAETGPGAEIPSCPGWVMDDLVAHVAPPLSGWYTYLIQCPPESCDTREAWMSAEPLPDGFEDRLTYLEHAATTFVDLVSSLDLDTPSWALYTAAPARFWALRTATETAVHLWDAQGALGEAPRLTPDRAAASIEETISGMWPGLVRWKRNAEVFPEFPGYPDRSMGLRATDSGRSWRIDPGVEEPTALETSDLPVTVLAGAGHDLVMYQWGRTPISAFSVEGDVELIEQWNLNLLATSFLGN